MKLLNGGMTERRVNASTIELKTFGCAFDDVNIVLKPSRLCTAEGHGCLQQDRRSSANADFL